MPFDFWAWADPQEERDLRALDFQRTAEQSINRSNADLWGRDAGQLLDNSRTQLGDLISNTLNSVRSAVAEPVQKAVEPVQRAVQGGQQAADQFSEWAGSRLGEVRAKMPGYDALDQPSTTPARDDWRVGDQPSEPSKPPAVAPEGSGSALLDALNEHTSGGTSPAKVTAQPDSAPKKPPDVPFPPDTTVTRDDYRKEYFPQLYQETPNATPPWSGQDRGTVNPGLAPLDNALRQVQDLFGGSRANPNPGQSQYNGLYTDPATYGGNAVSATPHQIGINARDHLVGVMRDYWQASGGKEPDSDQGLSSIARVLTESMAHEVAHDTDAEHSRVHAATTKQISQADGSAGYQTIYNALKQMRDAGDLQRVVDTAKAGTSPNPNEIAPPRTAAASVSPMERGGDSGSPLLDALNAHTQQQDNPDQPSGLSGVPKASVTPTFAPQSINDPPSEPMSDREKAAREPDSGGIGGAVLSGLGAQDATDRFNQQGEQSGRTELWNNFLGTLGVIHDESVQKAAQEFADAQARGESTDGVFDRLKLAIRSGVVQAAAGRALQPAEQLAAKLAADSEDATAQAADAALKMFGIDREGKGGTPNPLGTGKIGGITVPGLRAVGEFAGVDPNARIGLADAVHVADAFKPLQAVAQGGQFVEHPLETAGALAGIHYGGKLIGKAGEALADSAPVRRAGEIVGGLRDLGDQMTRGLPGGAPTLGVVAEHDPATADLAYHGTSGAFDRPDPTRLDDGALYGPGLYHTSDPRVAGGLVAGKDEVNPRAVRDPSIVNGLVADLKELQARAAALSDRPAEAMVWDRKAEAVAEKLHEYYQNTSVPYPEGELLSAGYAQAGHVKDPSSGPNVRQVSIPKDLNLLYVDEPITDAQAQAIREVMGGDSGVASPGELGETVYQGLARAYGKAEANDILSEAGFDGIRHWGGHIRPMNDEVGNPIQHTSTVIFKQSQDKITNAISGAKGGLVAFDPSGALAGIGQGAVGGGLAGGYDESQKDGATPQDVAKGIVGGMAMGAATRGFRMRGGQGSPVSQLVNGLAHAAQNAPQNPITWTDRFKAINNAALLGPATAAVNASANTLDILWHLPKELYTNVREQGLGDGARVWSGEIAGLAGSFGRAGERLLDAVTGRGQITTDLLARSTNPIDRALFRITGVLAGTFSEAPDALRELAVGMGLNREAGRIVAEQKLTGQAATQEFDRLVNGYWAAKNGNAALQIPEFGRLDKATTDFADHLSLRRELGTRSAAVGKAIDALGPLGGLFMPFYKTPVNALARLLEMSPAGVFARQSRAAKEYDVVVGTVLAAGLYSGTMQGKLPIGGGGPESPTERTMLRESGWRPYHTQVGSLYLPNSAFGVYGPLLNVIGDLADSSRYMKANASTPDRVQEVIKRLGSAVTDTPYLSGLSDVLRLLKGEQELSGFLASKTAQFIPGSATGRTIAAAMDPFERKAASPEAVGYPEAFSQRLRLATGAGRNAVAVDRTVLGAPSSNPRQGLAGILTPNKAVPRTNPLLDEYRRLDLTFPQGQPDKLGDTDLNGTQKQRYAEMAPTLRAQLAAGLLASDTYKKADDEARKRLLQAATSRASAWAGQAIVPSSDREGYEFTTKAVGGDPAKAVDGYLKAVALQEQLKQAQATRYLGVKGPAAEQLMGDVRERGAFRQALGKAKGDLEFVRKVGAARYAKADGAQVDPRYDLLRQRIEKDPSYATYFGSRAVLDLAR